MAWTMSRLRLPVYRRSGCGGHSRCDWRRHPSLVRRICHQDHSGPWPRLTRAPHWS